jgi:WD40 repeat protein
MKDGIGLVSGSLDKTIRYWDVSQLVGGGFRSPSAEKSRSKMIYNGHLVSLFLSISLKRKESC